MRPSRACAPDGASSTVRSICVAAFALGRGIVMALPHVGSWEWGGYWLALEGMPMTAVVERLEPPQLFEWFVAQRAAMGLTAVPLGEGSSGALLRALKEGEIAGLVSDRDLVGNGVEVEFFGERTTLPGGAATLALRTGAPLVPVVVYSGPGNWHTGVVHAPVDTARRGSLREDIARVTQDLAEVFEDDIRRRPRAVAPLPTELAERPTMKVAMLSPYSLTRPGGVQGQAMGLARSLRTLGHEVTVLGPADAGVPVPRSAGEHYVIGRPTPLPSNGSVAPVALWPTAAARAERFVRAGGFDVLHLHEPLAPMAAYGLVLTAPLPMVGTYHRAGVSRWVTPLKPLAELVGQAAADPGGGLGGRPRDGRPLRWRQVRGALQRSRHAALRVGRARTRRAGPAHRPVPRAPRTAQGPARAPRCVREGANATAVLWVAGDGPASEVQRRRHPESDRVRWLGLLSDEEVATRLAGADVLCAPSLLGESFGMVLLEGMAAGCAVVASDIEGYRAAAGGHAVLVPPGDVPALTRALDTALAGAVEGSGQSATEERKDGDRLRPPLVDGGTRRALRRRVHPGDRCLRRSGGSASAHSFVLNSAAISAIAVDTGGARPTGSLARSWPTRATRPKPPAMVVAAPEVAAARTAVATATGTATGTATAPQGAREGAATRTRVDAAAAAAAVAVAVRWR